MIYIEDYNHILPFPWKKAVCELEPLLGKTVTVFTVGGGRSGGGFTGLVKEIRQDCLILLTEPNRMHPVNTMIMRQHVVAITYLESADQRPDTRCNP